MKERVEVSKPRYEAPKVVTYDREKLLKLVGPVKGVIQVTPA
jgi:hypothetical protein